MNRYEKFRRGVLEKAAMFANWNGTLHVSTIWLAAEYGIPESHVREQLACLAAEQFISLAAWDGQCERQYEEWPDAESFFSNSSDSGQVRIRLLSAGGEFLSALPKAPIGFASDSR